MDRAYNFYEALELMLEKGQPMRMIDWSPDVRIVAQRPDEHSKMTAPYLYVESRFGRVPWLPTQIEMFSNSWEYYHERV